MSEPRTVYEKFSEHGLFTTYLQMGGRLPFETTLSGEQLDLLYITKCGERMLSHSGRTLTVAQIALYLKELYSSLWEDKYNMFVKTRELANGDITTHTEKIVDDNNTDVDSTATKQVSAFNDEDEAETTNEDEEVDYFVDNDKTNTKTNTKTDNERQKDYTKTTLRLKDRELLGDLLQTEFLCDTIFVDINHFITLSIF